LFGDGGLNLQDPSEEKSTTTSTTASSKEQTKKNYGALSPPSDDANTEEEKLEEGVVLLNEDEAAYVKTKMVDPETLKPHKPGQNPCLWLFHWLEGVSTVAAFCLLVTQILPFFLVRFRDIPQRIGVLNMALKVYISLFCVLFIFNETEAPVPLVRRSALLKPFFSRGFLYSFLGLICVEEAYSERVKDIVSHAASDEFHVGWAAIFMEVTSWLMLSCGVVYLLLGMCCMKGLRDRIKQNEIDAWKKYREEMKEWHKRFG